jgi:hypothetical protein
MIDLLMWFMIIVSFLWTIVGSLMLLTILKAVFRIMDRIEEVEDSKVSKPLPPPTSVPLEKM